MAWGIIFFINHDPPSNTIEVKQKNDHTACKLWTESWNIWIDKEEGGANRRKTWGKPSVPRGWWLTGLTGLKGSSREGVVRKAHKQVMGKLWKPECQTEANLIYNLMFTHNFINLPKLGNLTLHKCISFLLNFLVFKGQLPVKCLDWAKQCLVCLSLDCIHAVWRLSWQRELENYWSLCLGKQFKVSGRTRSLNY